MLVLENGDRWMVEVEKRSKTAIAMLKTGALVALDSVVGSARGAQGLKTQDAGRRTQDAGRGTQDSGCRAQTQ